NCQFALMSQVRTRREWGSQLRTRPQSHVLPWSPRSYQRPPTRGSRTASTAFALPVLHVARNHHPALLSVARRHATAGGAAARAPFRTLFGSVPPAIVCSVIVSSPWPLPAQPLA